MLLLIHVPTAVLLCAMGSAAGWCSARLRPMRHGVARGPRPRLQEPPFPLPYEVPPLPKPYADYEWDDSYPGTMKPGKRTENRDMTEVMEMWEDKENGNSCCSCEARFAAACTRQCRSLTRAAPTCARPTSASTAQRRMGGSSGKRE